MRVTRGADGLRLAVVAGFVLAGGCGGTPAAPGGTPLSSEGFFEGAGARLHYVLQLPEGRGPFPAVVIGHGSGRATTSDGAAYVPFLLERGFAVLRYDKRGVGQSTGTYRGVSANNSEAQITELGADLAAGVSFLAHRPEADARRIGLMGTSQAGWVMVAAAERSPGLRFVVAVSGSVLSVGRNIYYEGLSQLPIEEAYARLPDYAGPPGYDPAPVLQASRVPSLWLLGGQDRQVPARECLRILDRLRSEGVAVEWAVYPAADHGLPAVSYWPDIDAFLGRHGLP
jgi:dienelactone hydrolase